jgi:CubicO group peptidase (beta-lactamase class C family)
MPSDLSLGTPAAFDSHTVPTTTMETHRLYAHNRRSFCAVFGSSIQRHARQVYSEHLMVASWLEACSSLQQRIEDAQQRLGVPGVGLGIVYGGREFTAGFGITSTENPLPVNADTLMQIGSITKTFTATAIMRLVEAGLLDLDRPVQGYLPELRMSDAAVTSELTLTHLLTHTGGFVGDDFSDTGGGDDALARYVSGMAELPQLTPPGATWSYCNSGFCLAGRVIEVVTGKPFEAALDELLLQPLGMAHAFFFPAEVMTHRFVVGHQKPDDADPVVARPWPIPRASNAAGGITTSVNDLLRYAHFQLSDGVSMTGERLLDADTLRMMHTPHATAGGEHEALGLAWHLRHVDGTLLVEHGGATNGQIAMLRIVPEHGFAIVLLTNSGTGGRLCKEVGRWALSQFLDLEASEPALVARGREELAEYVGVYETSMMSIDVSLGETGLVVQVTSKGGFPTRDSPPFPSPPPTRLAFVGDDRVMLLDPPFAGDRTEFLRHADGSLAWLRWGGRIAARRGAEHAGPEPLGASQR